MHRIALGVSIIAIAVASPAFAGFIETRAQWQRMTQAGKLDYVTGLADGIMTYYEGEPFSEARARGWRACLQTNELNNGEILQMVEAGYSDVANWSVGPLSILINQMNLVCKGYENVERQRLGIEPLQ